MSKKKENGCRRGLIEYLSVKAELPSDAIAGETRIELRGREQVFINGCRRILEYSSELIVLSVKKDKLYVVGERLICSSYHGGTVCIEGRICKVYFSDGGAE